MSFQYISQDLQDLHGAGGNHPPSQTRSLAVDARTDTEDPDDQPPQPTAKEEVTFRREDGVQVVEMEVTLFQAGHPPRDKFWHDSQKEQDEKTK